MLFPVIHVYTKNDLENVDEAIEKLQLGKRIVSVSYGNHTVRYADINLNDLLALKQKIKASLGDSSKTKLRHMHFSTHKGIEYV